MENINNGGAAFPEHIVSEDGIITLQQGMSLRDYFAGQVLVGIIMKYGVVGSPGKLAYEISDEMLKAREVK